MIDLMKRVEPILLQKVHDPGSSSDLGAWVQIAGDLEFTCKIFNNPKIMSSDKENTPIIDTQTMLTLTLLMVLDLRDFLKDPQILLVLTALSEYSNGQGAFALLNQIGKTK